MKMTIIERYAKLSILGHWKKKFSYTKILKMLVLITRCFFGSTVVRTRIGLYYMMGTYTIYKHVQKWTLQQLL